jgi:hypothetical protein
MGRTVDWGETIVIDGSPPAASNAAAKTANIEIARATHHRMHFLQGLRQPSNRRLALPTCPSFKWHLEVRHHFVQIYSSVTIYRHLPFERPVAKIDVFDTNFAKPAGMQRKFIDLDTTNAG